jgi:F-type H+-transporting ATPase subunit b
MSILTPEPGLVFWMLLVFGIVFFVLAKFGFPVITKSIDKRKDFIAKALEDAKKSEEKLVTVQQQCDLLIQDAQNQKDAILREASEKKERIMSEARDQSLAEGRRLAELAKMEAEAEKQKAMRSLHNEMALVSVQMSELILRRELKESDEQKALIDRFLSEMDDKQL